MKNAHKPSAIGAKWADATGVDPGDKGQISKKAMEYINNLGLDSGDAWLSAMTNWMTGMPYPDSKSMLADAMIMFLDRYEGQISFSAVTILSARQSAAQTAISVDLHRNLTQ